MQMGSHTNGVVPGDRAASSNGGSGTTVDKGVDFANYFCTYSFLYHQKEMLSDRVRMDAYFNSIFRNKHHFRGKVRFIFCVLISMLCFNDLKLRINKGWHFTLVSEIVGLGVGICFNFFYHMDLVLV